MEHLNEYLRWTEKTKDLPELHAELTAIAEDPAEINERFCRSLTFGTGGLRGVIGAGTNRMNVFTVAQATQGLAGYLKKQTQPGKKAVIAYDSRINSRLFAETAAEVLAANGIEAYLFPRLAPTPLLSFSVRELGCGAGICITASHNPAKYNGYKVYGPDGCQITVDAAAAIQGEIRSVDVLTGAARMKAEAAEAAGLLHTVGEEVFDRYIARVLAQRMPENGGRTPLRVVYTPLNGAGRECVLRILEGIGVDDVTVVPSQEMPDGTFPTCPYPNPEEREALAEGLKLCGQLRPDLLLATDPDCDRVGAAAAEDSGGYRLISGNEMGVLLLDYICRMRTEAGTMPRRPTAMTTIVSTDMADAVAGKYGVELRRTLTGFKFIGEQIGFLERSGEKERFIFGFEESYGYLSGTHARDKDAVNASMLICQAARYYKAKGMTLGRAVDALYDEYGYYRSKLLSFSFEGPDGMERMKEIMRDLRNVPPSDIAGLPVSCVKDYMLPQGELPRSDVLEFGLGESGKTVIRPSGTEPKLKLYLFAHMPTADEADGELARIERACAGLIEKR
ncbi:MAG: phospho-sugar mutase [Oscillospiraceae bacterium]|nr:phospho-sugar mutase [Oscillospiraceae bacterium]